MQQGWFITVEGGEGAGKTSSIHALAAYLTSCGHEVVTTREPGGIPIAEQIRGVILDRNNTEMEGRTEALLYAAARRQHLVEKVIPALQAGRTVICDRFVDSSLAYQGHARGLGIDAVYAINRFAIGDTMPDLTVVLDVSPEVGLARIHADGTREVNRLDLETVAFHHMVREGFQLLAQRFTERIVVVNAEQHAEAVQQEMIAIVRKRLLPSSETGTHA